ncbi:hypothetical protein C8R47DRAFT_1323681 [Mycena vitilis]|nr:hypothetical protein C8R47DRAFT_1323681 [Mycena vitilis]
MPINNTVYARDASPRMPRMRQQRRGVSACLIVQAGAPAHLATYQGSRPPPPIATDHDAAAPLRARLRRHGHLHVLQAATIALPPMTPTAPRHRSSAREIDAPPTDTSIPPAPEHDKPKGSAVQVGGRSGLLVYHTWGDGAREAKGGADEDDGGIGLDASCEPWRVARTVPFLPSSLILPYPLPHPLSPFISLASVAPANAACTTTLSSPICTARYTPGRARRHPSLAISGGDNRWGLRWHG